MVLATRVESLPTLCTLASTIHVLLDVENMFTRSAKYSLFISLTTRPYIRFVAFKFIVAADTSVKFVAANMLDGYYVEIGVPVCTLGEIGDRLPMDHWRLDSVVVFLHLWI